MIIFFWKMYWQKMREKKKDGEEFGNHLNDW